jgi:DNA-binding response OmpR family regulator
MFEAEPRSARKKILVIDELPERRALARNALECHGFDVEVAHDTTLGGLKLMARRPDLMVLDLCASGVDGFQFIEYVREVTTPPPVVFLSGSREVGTVLRGVALGAVTFLPKPVNFSTLAATCRAALSRQPIDAGHGPGERRAHQRHEFVVPVRMLREDSDPRTHAVHTKRGFARGELQDLSAGGARVVVPIQVPVGARVQLMPDPEVIDVAQDLLAEVRVSQAAGAGFRHGVRFVDLDPATERALQEHLGQACHAPAVVA